MTHFVQIQLTFCVGSVKSQIVVSDELLPELFALSVVDVLLTSSPDDVDNIDDDNDSAVIDELVLIIQSCHTRSGIKLTDDCGKCILIGFPRSFPLILIFGNGLDVVSFCTDEDNANDNAAEDDDDNDDPTPTPPVVIVVDNNGDEVIVAIAADVTLAMVGDVNLFGVVVGIGTVVIVGDNVFTVDPVILDGITPSPTPPPVVVV